jgi:hypothetical protein
MPRHAARPARPEDGFVLCGCRIPDGSGRSAWTGCLGRLRDDLCQLADLLGVLDELMVTPAPVDGNDRRAARTDAPAPCRLDVLDLCDPRSDTPALHTVDTWALLVAQELRTAALPGTTAERARWLAGQAEWLARHPAADEAAADLGQARRWVAAAAGLGPRPPLFACPVVWPDGDGDRECGGPVLPMVWAFGARCARCGSEWDGAAEMRRLGLIRSG